MNTKIKLTFVTLSVLGVLFYGYRRASSDEAPAVVSETALAPEIIESDLPEPAIADVVEFTTRSDYARRSFAGSRGGEIKGPEGTRLRFAPNSFMDASGNIVSGKIRIELKECYDLDDILKSRLSTTSDHKIIETAGMVEVNAYSGSERVQLRPGFSFDVAFPRSGKLEDDYLLFYGRWMDAGHIDWQLAESKALVDTAKISAKSENTNGVFDSGNCFLQIVESSLRRKTSISKMDFFNWRLVNGQTLNQWFVSNFNPDLKMLGDYCAQGLRTQITFHVSESGRLDNYYISHEALPEYDCAIANFFSTMPPLNLKLLMPEYTHDHACVLTFSSHPLSSSDAMVSRFKSNFGKDEVLTDVATADLDYYIFSSASLGWLNCDRFVSEPSELVNVRISAKGGADAIVSMVFDDINSVLNAQYIEGSFLFRGVPNGRSVRVICIDNSGGQTQISEQHLVTAEKSFVAGNYNKVGLAELDLCFSATLPVSGNSK